MLPPRIHWLEVTSLSTRFSGVGGPSRKSKQSQDSQAKWVLAERSDDKHKTDKDVVNNRLLVWRLGGGFPYFLFSPLFDKDFLLVVREIEKLGGTLILFLGEGPIYKTNIVMIGESGCTEPVFLFVATFFFQNTCSWSIIDLGNPFLLLPASLKANLSIASGHPSMQYYVK